MRNLLFIALFVFCGVSHAAAPSVTCTPNRTSGTAPLSVFLDCTSTTGVTMHTGLFSHNFGDTSPGSWTTGSVATSKNFAKGIIAGHVYETAGTFTITSVVCNSSMECARATNAITVTAANTTFASTATVCFYNSTVGTGCPTGATETQSSDFDAAITACAGNTKRCLFKRGDTFTASATSTLTATGPLHIGAYGSGAKPIISAPSELAGGIIAFGTASADTRLVDLNMVGSGASETAGTAVVIAAAVNTATMLRLTIGSIGKGIIVSGTNSLTGGVIQDSTISGMSAASGGVGIFGKFVSSAILGNYVGPFETAAEHNIRIQPGQKVVVSNNTAETPGDSGKTVFSIRAAEHATGADPDPTNDTQYVVMNNNKAMGGATSVQIFQIGPASNSQNNWISDVVVDGLWLVFGSVGQQGLYGEAKNVAVRNSICDASVGAANRYCFSNDNTTTVESNPPTTVDWVFANNTCYSSGASTTFTCVTTSYSGTGTVTDTVLANNLAYAPSATTARNILADTGSTNNTGASGTNGNSSDDQTKNTSPSFALATPSNPVDFRISTSSYADAGGTASFPAQNRDFYNCEDKTGDNRIGALVAAANRQCYGVAQ